MDSIKRLFRVVPPESRAAHTLEILQQQLNSELQTDAQHVRAVSVRNGAATVHVFHPALAARIQQREREILQTTNKKLEAQVAGQTPLVKIVCRTTGLQ